MPFVELARADAMREIYLRGGDLPIVVNTIESLLTAHDPHIRQHQSRLYDISTGRPVRMTSALLRLRTMQLAQFYKQRGRRRHFWPLDPPLKYFDALLRKGDWAFPQLLVDSGGEIN